MTDHKNNSAPTASERERLWRFVAACRGYFSRYSSITVAALLVPAFESTVYPTATNVRTVKLTVTKSPIVISRRDRIPVKRASREDSKASDGGGWGEERKVNRKTFSARRMIRSRLRDGTRYDTRVRRFEYDFRATYELHPDEAFERHRRPIVTNDAIECKTPRVFL